MATITCQICGRSIKAKSGVIAHHGYMRPKGWYPQTNSCYGTRHAPYEVGHDALDQYIPQIEQQATRVQDALIELQVNPPLTLTYITLDGFSKHIRKRPEGFDSMDVHPDRSPGSYATIYLDELRTKRNTIRQLHADLEYLRQRRAEWKA